MKVQGYKLKIDYKKKSDSHLFKNIRIDEEMFKNQWKAPSYITNLIITESSFLDSNELLIKSLNLLNCKHIVWFLKEDNSLENIEKFTKEIIDSDINSMQLIVKYKVFIFQIHLAILLFQIKS